MSIRNQNVCCFPLLTLVKKHFSVNAWAFCFGAFTGGAAGLTFESLKI